MQHSTKVGFCLKTKEGKYVLVRKTTRLELHAVDQSNKPKMIVHIWRQEGQIEQMAFCFLYNNGHYFPKVDGNNLQVEKFDTLENLLDNLTDHHRFAKNNVGSDEYYTLRSVVSGQHICMNRPSNRLSLTTNVDQSAHFWVTNDND
ncbi:hypothetical protein LDENG_00107460 [Lucifuga dentata]|nr:hypothetical protein LDENG_00107460 [Lucifuga dentata]